MIKLLRNNTPKTLLLCVTCVALTAAGCVTKKGFEEKTQSLESSIESARSEISIVSRDVSANRTSLDNVTTGLTGVRTDLESINARIIELASRVTATETTLGETNEKIVVMTGDTAALTQRVESLAGDIAALDKRSTSTATMAEQIAGELGLIKVLASKLNNDMKALSDNVAKSLAEQENRNLADRKILIGILQAEHDTLQSRSAQLKEAVEALKLNATATPATTTAPANE